MNENCYKNCKGYANCLNAALDNNECRCINFGELKANVNDAVCKLSDLGIPTKLSKEDIKDFIYFACVR